MEIVTRDTRTLTMLQRAAVVFITVVLALAACPSSAFADACPAGGEHEYSVDLVRQATEYEEGFKIFTCTKCGYTFEHVVPITGHAWGPWIVDQEPTCTSEGHEYRVCEQYAGSPHYDERIIPTLSATGEHSYVVTEERVPTCTEPGYKVYTCDLCGESYREEASALGHEWREWTVETEPTEGKEGQRKRVCLHDASHVEYETIAALEAEPQDPKDEQPTLEIKEVAADINNDPGFFSFKPTLFDGVMLAFDGLLVLVFVLLIIPFFVQLRWNKRKVQEAFENHLKEEKETL